jgi:CheY-like chemotaxis protein
MIDTSACIAVGDAALHLLGLRRGFVKALKANPATRDITVLISTGYAAGVDTQRAIDAGAAEILLKPLDITRLREVLFRYLPIQEGTTSS